MVKASELLATGVTHHAALTGLNNDDHPQYLNVARGDIRYYVKTEIDTALTGKSDTGHSHTLNDLSNVTISSIANGEIIGWNGSAFVNRTLAEAGIAPLSHSHAWGDVTGKPSSFAPSAHSHPISDVTGLQTELDSKAVLNRVIVSDAHTATAEQFVCVDTSSAAITITAPASPRCKYIFCGIRRRRQCRNQQDHGRFWGRELQRH